MTTTITNRTFGVEIECNMPAGYHRGMVASALVAAGINARDESYNHATRRHWKITTDGSLDWTRGMEVVSPVLRGESGLNQLRTVMEVLTRIGCKVDVKCGLHVHVDANDLSLPQLKNVAKAFVKFENFFDHIMPASRRASTNTFVQSNRAIHGGYGDDAANRAMARINEARCQGSLIRANQVSRYFKMNLVPLGTYGTIEFRQHSGTVNADKAEHWVRLLVAFVEQAKSARSRARRVTDEAVKPAEEMQRFFRMFDVPAATREFYLARRRELHRDANTLG